MPRNKTLERLPVRALTFLRGIAKYPDIRRALTPAGYTLDVQRQGFALLEAATGFWLEGSGGPNPAAAAIDAVSEWYGPAFGRVEAALRHLHPAQASYVTGGLASVSGPAAVVASMVFLERLDDLAGAGPGAKARKGSAAEDRAAMHTLAVRGFDAAELQRVGALIETAKRGGGGRVAGNEEAEDEKRLLALKAWVDDWTATARSVIRKRSDLIKLGMARPSAGRAE